MAVVDSMVYDVAGNLRTKFTRRGQTLTSYADSRNRDTLTTLPGIGDVKRNYGGPLDQVIRLYLVNAVDSIGNVKREVRWAYDQRGRLKSDTAYTGTVVRATTYAYDTYERRSTMTDVNGTWTTRYDATLGLPVKLVTPYSDSISYSYDSELRSIGPTIMSSGPQNTVTPFWNVTGLLDSLTHVVATTPNAFTPLTYSRGGVDIDDTTSISVAPFWKQQMGAGAIVDTLRDSVAYDGWQRVTSVVAFGIAHKPFLVARDTFGFDRMGNIRTTAGAEVYDATTARLTSRTAGLNRYDYYYDRAGNPDSVRVVLISSGAVLHRWRYGWDVLNRLESVRYDGVLMARYSYDMLGRRIAKRVYSATSGGVVGYTRFVYHGADVAFETDSAGAIWRRYTWGMGVDDLIGVRDSVAGQPLTQYYAVKDKLGSIRGLVKRDGTWQYSERFGPYGASINFIGTDIGLRYRWTAREYDAETGFYFFRARYYEPFARRFVQEDPSGFNGGTNVYAYSRNSPLETRDPSGLAPNAIYVHEQEQRRQEMEDAMASAGMERTFFLTAQQKFEEWSNESNAAADAFFTWLENKQKEAAKGPTERAQQGQQGRTDPCKEAVKNDDFRRQAKIVILATQNAPSMPTQPGEIQGHETEFGFWTGASFVQISGLMMGPVGAGGMFADPPQIPLGATDLIHSHGPVSSTLSPQDLILARTVNVWSVAGNGNVSYMLTTGQGGSCRMR